jgi:putative hydrolase of the HAD superfamily
MKERSIPANDMFASACRIYEREKLNNISPYPGVIPALREIQDLGFPMVIVTDAQKADAIKRLGKCGLNPYFDTIITSDLVKKKKPDPGPFLYGLHETRTLPENTLFVGDSPRRDIEPCTRLGIRTVYARYGDRFSTTRPCTTASFTIDAMQQLPSIVRKLARQ